MFIHLKKYSNLIICIILTLIFISLSIFYFDFNHLRIIESFKDLFDSFKYYLNELFDFKFNVNLSVNKLTAQDYSLPFNLPQTWNKFKFIIKEYFKLFFSLNNLKSFIIDVLIYIEIIAQIITIVLPLFLIFYLLVDRTVINNNYSHDSSPLKFYKKIEDFIFKPIKSFFLSLNKYVKNSIFKLLWIIIWLFNLNIITILIELLAYYLYFISSFDISSIYIQIFKLLIDLNIMIEFIPGFIWLLIFIFFFHKLRVSRALNILNNYEYRNRGFINERSIVLMLNGTMGKKKTTIITDIALSQEAMLRDKALDLLLDCDMEFPNFPWINLELFIKSMIKHNHVKNLSSIKKIIRRKKEWFNDHPLNKNIFYYDYEKYGLTYNNNLFIKDIWDTIEEYAQLYFVYIIQSSLIISNYSIRSDNEFIDFGNFPLWSTDFLNKNPYHQVNNFSHILDFDMLRLGKKVIENNKKENVFEFGVVVITEIGKERGNAIENQTFKKTDDEANPKNDLFNSWLKMCRHSSTIRNFPFIKVICDDQRPESLGADARELTEIVYINKCSPKLLSLNFFEFEELVINFLYKKFINYYLKIRNERGDNLLIIYILKKFIFSIYNYYTKIYNSFGFYELDLDVEKGTLDGIKDCKKYYLNFKKIYSKRFSTDCFSDFFHSKSIKSTIGLNDLESFKSIKATYEEMELENSYFFNDLTKKLK